MDNEYVPEKLSISFRDYNQKKGQLNSLMKNLNLHTSHITSVNYKSHTAISEWFIQAFEKKLVSFD